MSQVADDGSRLVGFDSQIFDEPVDEIRRILFEEGRGFGRYGRRGLLGLLGMFRARMEAGGGDGACEYR